MASERDQLKSLIDRVPDDRLPAIRAAVEDLLAPASATSASPRQKNYPRRTPVGGIITPQ